MSVPGDPSGSCKACFDFKRKELHKGVTTRRCDSLLGIVGAGGIFGDQLSHEEKWNQQLKVKLAVGPSGWQDFIFKTNITAYKTAFIFWLSIADPEFLSIKQKGAKKNFELR